MTPALFEALDGIQIKLDQDPEFNPVAEFNRSVLDEIEKSLREMEIDRLKKALQDSLDKVAAWKQADEESLATRESYDDATRGTFDAEGRVWS